MLKTSEEGKTTRKSAALEHDRLRESIVVLMSSQVSISPSGNGRRTLHIILDIFRSLLLIGFHLLYSRGSGVREDGKSFLETIKSATIKPPIYTKSEDQMNKDNEFNLSEMVSLGPKVEIPLELVQTLEGSFNP
ncbi:hypothetical protein M9H77_34106 [Catharanthus roseus]|uniref:Uncharacterized protein n=1 Tax=Catharanthus roseus TaxID=4058 RepID=A0ACB9ZMQ2_CATRO|nr:hypothetical protein M9H77_34106 [Catharanthus roseus]